MCGGNEDPLGGRSIREFSSVEPATRREPESEESGRFVGREGKIGWIGSREDDFVRKGWIVCWSFLILFNVTFILECSIATRGGDILQIFCDRNWKRVDLFFNLARVKFILTKDSRLLSYSYVKLLNFRQPDRSHSRFLSLGKRTNVSFYLVHN